MNLDDLTKLPFDELRRIQNKNLTLFRVLTLIDLLVFYHSLFAEKWLLLFLSFGVFVGSLSLYDNYRLARDLASR